VPSEAQTTKQPSLLSNSGPTTTTPLKETRRSKTGSGIGSRPIGKLKVTVVQGRDLVPLDSMGGIYGYYCKLSMEGQQEKTNCLRNTSSPTWNQSFTFFQNNMLAELVVSLYFFNQLPTTTGPQSDEHESGGSNVPNDNVTHQRKRGLDYIQFVGKVIIRPIQLVCDAESDQWYSLMPDKHSSLTFLDSTNRGRSLGEIQLKLIYNKYLKI